MHSTNLLTHVMIFHSPLEESMARDHVDPADATPEQNHGACYFDAPQVMGQARAHRELLASALGRAGQVNYPTEWWHWSYGGRYSALVTGAPAALHGPVAADRVLV